MMKGKGLGEWKVESGKLKVGSWKFGSWKVGRLGGWEVGKLGVWKNGKMEGWECQPSNKIIFVFRKVCRTQQRHSFYKNLTSTNFHKLKEILMLHHLLEICHF
jgi:hypothetical protein